MIETSAALGMVEASDAMVAARVGGWLRKVGGGFVTAVVRDVQSPRRHGSWLSRCGAVGELVSVHIPRPHANVDAALPLGRTPGAESEASARHGTVVSARGGAIVVSVDAGPQMVRVRRQVRLWLPLMRWEQGWGNRTFLLRDRQRVRR